MTIKQSVFEFLDTRITGETFTGHTLRKYVHLYTGHRPYPATCLRYLREWRAVDGRSVPNVSKRKSLYEIKEVK